MTDEELPLGLLAALFPVLYASIVWHEAGHAVLGRAAGYVVTSFGMGTARPFCVLRVGGARAYFCLIRPFQGLTFAFPPTLVPRKGPQVAFLAGGILFNALLAAVSVAVFRWLPWGSSIWLVSAAINAVLALTSLIPAAFRIGGATMHTDGLSILRTLRSAPAELPAPLLIQTEASFRPLWLATGDFTAARVYRLIAAQAWAGLEDFERAEAALRDARALPGPEPAWVGVLGLLIQGYVELTSRRLDDAATTLDAVEALGRGDSDELRLWNVRLNREVLRLYRGDARDALAALDDMRSDALAARNPARAASLLVARLSARATLGDVPGVDELLAEYEAASPRNPASQDLGVYKAVARFHAQRGDWGRAEPAYRRALAAAHALAAMWPEGEERARFVDRQSALFDEAGHCFRMNGREEVAELVAAPGPRANVPWYYAQDWPERNRRMRRAGVTVMLLNVLVVAGSASLVPHVPHGPWRGSCALLAAGLGLFTVAAILYLLFDLSVGRLVPVFRQSGGAVILLLVGLGWLSAAFAVVLALL